MSRLVIYTDGKSTENTKIIIDNKFFSGVQKIKFSASMGNMPKCVIDFFPIESSTIDLADLLMAWDNVFEINCNGSIANTFLKLNGQMLSRIQEIEFVASVYDGVNIKLKQKQTNSDIVEIVELENLPQYNK